MLRLPRTLLLPGLMMLVAGCDGLSLPGTGEAPPDTVAVDSSGADTTSAVVPDSLTAGADGAPGDPLAEAPDPSAGASPGDTTRLSGDDLEARLARLEAQNDSLRNTILGLVALQTRPPTARRDTAGTASEILALGTDEVQHWGFRIFLTLLFLAFVALVIKALVWTLDQLAERSAKRRLLFKRLGPVSRIFIWALALPFAAMVVLGIEAQALVAAGAAVGVAVGFAAQDILKNIFGGLIVLFDQPFQVGDKVRVGENYGEVVSIGLRSTRMVTPDDNLVTVPNAQVVDGQVANANAGELNCQVVTDLWLPGSVDEAEAKRIAFEAAASSKYVFLNKPIVVLVLDEFEYTFLTHLKVKAYVLDPRYEFLFMSDVTERARAGFRQAGLLDGRNGGFAAPGGEPFSMPHMPAPDRPSGGAASESDPGSERNRPAPSPAEEDS